MSGFTISDNANKNLQSLYESPTKITRQKVIEIGVNNLHEIGSDHICKVCIDNGGSCCSGCRHLSNGIGCQIRNTSCTAWLCGFLKYVLYETGLLQEWNEYWDQVPGKDYREDFTPEVFFIEKSLSIPNIRNLSEALASDLQELARTHIAIGFIITLREKIDKIIDHLDYCKQDPKKQTEIKRKIKILSSPFHRFHKELRDYHQKYPNT